MPSLTRRSFIALSALSTLALAGGAPLAGCSPSGSSSLAESGSAETANADVLVVGSGISGLVSALSARKEGAERVVLIEKLPMLGGSAVGSMAGVVVNSKYTPSDVDDSIDRIMELHRTLQSYSARESEYPNYDKVEYYFSETGKTYELLKDSGVDLGEVVDNGTRAWYEYPDGPQAFMDSIVEAALNAGVEIIDECEAQDLIMENGEVIGVRAKQGSKSVDYLATTTILCAGGFGSNQEMLAEYVPEVAAAGIVNRGTAGATGECIKMAQEAGAAGFSDYWATISAGSITFTDDILAACEGIADLKLTRKTKQNIIVNSQGKRFSSEDVPDQSVIACYMILDGQGPNYILYSNPEAELQELFDKGVAAGVIAKADTIEELEQSLSMPANALVSTVSAYNEACEVGNDPEFGKPAESLVAFQSGPYYALEFYTKMIGTMGGIQTNTSMEVLKEDGSPIPGLLAAGEITNRDLYNQVYLGGACIGIYSTMGRLSGITAAKRA